MKLQRAEKKERQERVERKQGVNDQQKTFKIDKPPRKAKAEPAGGVQGTTPA